MRNATTLNTARNEEHIVSVIVHLNSVYCASALNRIVEIEGVEIAAQENTKCVLLISDGSAKGVMKKIELMQEIPGVLNVAMVAHHAEQPESLNASVETEPEQQA